MKLAIIGGGASGLFAAANAAARTNSSGQKIYSEITIYEKLDRAGKKLLATGNGKCNLANVNISAEKYHSEALEFALGIIEKYPPRTIIDIFEGFGLLCKIEKSGRVYPQSMQASAVLDVLRFLCESRGVNILNGKNIKYIRKSSSGFLFGGDGEDFNAARVIIACGGRASPVYGSDGGGFELLRQTGHRITAVYPALTQLKTENTVTKSLKGIKFDQIITYYYKGERKGDSRGEVLFTEYGLSGTAVMEISRFAAVYGGGEVVLDALPDYSFNDVFEILKAKRSVFSEFPLEYFLTGTVNKRFGQAVLKQLGYNLSDKSGGLREGDINKIAGGLKKFTLTVTGTTGFTKAQATSGGAELSQFDQNTLESKICPGLFACGEVLDVCGACGGYNLTWAFASALAAAHGN